jgi:hypothetical protein
MSNAALPNGIAAPGWMQRSAVRIRKPLSYNVACVDPPNIPCARLKTTKSLG